MMLGFLLQQVMPRKKKTIKTRPIPVSQIHEYEEELANFNCDDQFKNLSVDEQTNTFHNFLRTNLEKFFPEKSLKLSSLDQKWMSPELKNLHRQKAKRVLP